MVPDALQTNYDFLNSCAIYFCGVVEQQLLIPPKNEEKRESVVLFVTNDSIYTGSEADELYRRVDFNAILGTVTDSDHLSRTNEDLVIVAELGYTVAVIVERLLLARGCPVATRKVAVDNTRQLTEVTVQLPPNPKPNSTTTTMDSDANRELTRIERHRQQILRDSIPRRRLAIMRHNWQMLPCHGSIS
ncbi:hypothetical protein LSM04_004081 [Trypanosoma melophagium]|uniref:uncharacterized protein n=1 Tax=Trypanosoma melophagium TaxID=715481 RepID=UPI00351A74E6|nr:hypothetical protein LSM04_004081 [Trypanosoma melophagium]